MNLWLDDLRDPANHNRADWVWIKTAKEAIELIRAGSVSSISFDHDLGSKLNGHDVASEIESLCAQGQPCPKWAIHSANPVGAMNIRLAMKSAERFARLNESNPV
jgi:NAD+-processing family protein with receiver domain